MGSYTPQIVFPLTCLLGFFVIAGAALYEIGRHRRGEGVISPVHFRVRMVSAAIWMAILLSLGYGVAFEWPRDKNDIEAITKLQQSFSRASMMMLLAGLLFAVDLWFTLKLRASYQMKGRRDINKFAQEEIARLKHKGKAE